METCNYSQEMNDEHCKELLIHLMKTYGSEITRLAFTYVKKKEDAEDIAQEVFIKCYQNLSNFRNASAYRTWLYKITINQCKDFLKSWHARNVKPLDLEKELHKLGVNNLEQQVASQSDNIVLFKAVLSLPTKFREAILLHFYRGLTQAEIAEILDIHPNTLRSRIQKGQLLLKKELKKEDFEWKTN